MARRSHGASSTRWRCRSSGGTLTRSRPRRSSPYTARRRRTVCALIYVGRAEIGAAWSKRSTEGRDYLSVKLDDPSFNAPIYANLFDDEDGEGFTLIWSRGRRQNGD